MTPARWITETLREWGWRHTAIGLLVGALALFSMGNMFFFPPDFNYARNLTYNVFEFGLPYVFALRVADRAVADGASRPLAYGVVVLGVIGVGVWLIGPLLLPWLGGEPDWTTEDDLRLAFKLFLPYALGTFAYAGWRRSIDTLERVQAAERARAEQEQVLQSARLLALQARVEPQFLFDALGRVRQAIDRSTEAAERLLGDLIALLRAMQPAAGATASSVEREFELVRAYARASESSALQEPRLSLQAEGDVLRARLAPLVLLPALRALAGDAPAAQWQVGAARVDDRLRIVITPAHVDEAAITALAVFDERTLGDRLTAVHGADAKLVTTRGAVAPALRIDAPFAEVPPDRNPPDEPDDRPDR